VESITVDELDQQLAQCPAADGRASFSAIAEVMGVSDQTVAHWFLRLRCVPGAGEAIAAALARRAETGTALAKFPEVAYATTTGPATLAACAVCRDEESLYD
jgi:AsnC-type helix-turn-helix domain